MAFCYCSSEISDAVDHVMVTQRNFMHSRCYNVSGTDSSGVVNNGRSGLSGLSSFLNKLLEAEQLVQFKNVL